MDKLFNLSQMDLAELIGTTSASTLNMGMDDMLCDSLPVASNHSEKDVAELLSDCSPKEKQLIKGIILTTKKRTAHVTTQSSEGY